MFSVKNDHPSRDGRCLLLDGLVRPDVTVRLGRERQFQKLVGMIVGAKGVNLLNYHAVQYKHCAR